MWGVALTLQTGAGARIENSLSAQLRGVVSTDQFSDDLRSWADMGVSGQLTANYNRLDASIAGSAGYRQAILGELAQSEYVLGQANASAQFVPGEVILDLAATAQQGRETTGSLAGGVQNLDAENTLQIYSFYAQPRLSKNFGRSLSMYASYNAGYTFTTGRGGQAGLAGTNATGLRESFTHGTQTSIGWQPGSSRLTLGLQSSWRETRQERFDQRFETARVGALANLYVDRSLRGGVNVGYETVENTQAAIILDPLTGFPVLDDDGDVVTDPGVRVTGFERRGAFGLANVSYTPSPRFAANMTAGYQDGGAYLSGRLGYRAGNYTSLSATVDRSLRTAGERGQRNRGFVLGDTTTVDLDGDGEAEDLDEIGFECPGGFSEQGEQCVFAEALPILSGSFRQTRGSLSARWQRNRSSLSASAFYEQRDYLDPEEIEGADPVQVPALNRGATYSFGGNLAVSQRMLDDQSISAAMRVAVTEDFDGEQIVRYTSNLNYRRGISEDLYLLASLSASTGGRSSTSGKNSLAALGVGVGYRF
ncbi:hypothetical protein B5C34_14325 [Pacificimonas flava]|uniref:Uncharacterized protein n=1 Tax=Pacificimonas flava TaxID=1234595 RepID=A0A219B9R2_9SPHN|nr:hypothetical protein B5C34_14325 [Pacificimonas flava]